MTSNPNKIISLQELKDAKEDAKDLGDALNTKQVITPRYGNQFNSLPLALDNLEKAIQVALAAGAGAAGWMDSLVQTWSGRTQEEKNKEFVSLHDYCLLNGTDETDKFGLAVNEAKQTGRKLVSFWGSIILSKDISLRLIEFDLSATYILMATGSSKLIVGWDSRSSLSKKQTLGTVQRQGTFHTSPQSLLQPTVRLAGAKCLRFTFSQIDYLELYASTDPATFPADGSIGYCTIIGDLATKLVIDTDPRYANGGTNDNPGNAGQWINSNFFHITRIMGLEIKGSYPHNGNIFYNPIIENLTSYIRIEHGNKNLFLNIRGENNPTIYFSEKTEGNIVKRCWYSTSSVFNLFENYTDLGRQNKYTSEQLEASKNFDIAKIKVTDFKQKNGYAGNYRFQQGTKKFIKGDGAGRIIYQTNIFDIDARDIFYFYCDSIDSNVSSYLARVYLYDVNGTLITDGDDSWRSGANFNGGSISQGYFEGTFSSLGQTWFNFLGGALSRVKKVSVMILNANTYTQSRSKSIHITLTTMRNDFSRVVTDIKPNESYDFVTSKPTRFIGRIGDTVVTNMTTNYKCSFYMDTKLSSIASTGDTIINLDSVSLSELGSISIGDLIGIDLDSEFTHWTAIKSISEKSVVLDTPLPSSSIYGSNVYISRLL